MAKVTKTAKNVTGTKAQAEASKPIVKNTDRVYINFKETPKVKLPGGEAIMSNWIKWSKGQRGVMECNRIFINFGDAGKVLVFGADGNRVWVAVEPIKQDNTNTVLDLSKAIVQE